MSIDENRIVAQAVDKAVLFLEALRKSSKMAHELIAANREMALRIQSLEADLVNAKARIGFLERETNQLRGGLARLAFDDEKVGLQFNEIIEEQNCLAHMFVTNEQFSLVRSPREAIKRAEEVLHNLIGASHFGIWIRWKEEDHPVLVSSSEKGESQLLTGHSLLIGRCLSTGAVQQPEGASQNAPPICVPLKLESRIVGAVLVVDLVPQRPVLERLHKDLLSLLCEKLAGAMCLGALQANLNGKQVLWEELRSTFPLQEEAAYA